MYKQILQERVIKLWRLAWPGVFVGFSTRRSALCFLDFLEEEVRPKLLSVTFDLGIGILSVCTVFVFTAFLKRTSATHLKYILQPQVVPLRSCNIVVHYL